MYYLKSVDGTRVTLITDTTYPIIQAAAYKNQHDIAFFGLFGQMSPGVSTEALSDSENLLSAEDIRTVMHNNFHEAVFHTLLDTQESLDKFLRCLMEALCKEISAGKRVISLADVAENAALSFLSARHKNTHA